MSDIDWSKAPIDYPIWIEALNGLESDWHRDAGDAYVDRFGREWTKPEEGFYVVHMPPAPWTGTGLPPVGTVCEFMCTARGKEREWQPALVKYASPFTVVLDDYSATAGELEGEFVAHPDTMRFRPIRTPEQIAADVLRQIIMATHVPTEYVDEVANAVWKSGYRKTEAP